MSTKHRQTRELDLLELGNKEKSTKQSYQDII